MPKKKSAPKSKSVKKKPTPGSILDQLEEAAPAPKKKMPSKRTAPIKTLTEEQTVAIANLALLTSRAKDLDAQIKALRADLHEDILEWFNQRCEEDGAAHSSADLAPHLETSMAYVLSVRPGFDRKSLREFVKSTFGKGASKTWKALTEDGGPIQITALPLKLDQDHVAQVISQHRGGSVLSKNSGLSASQIKLMGGRRVILALKPQFATGDKVEQVVKDLKEALGDKFAQFFEIEVVVDVSGDFLKNRISSQSALRDAAKQAIEVGCGKVVQYIRPVSK